MVWRILRIICRLSVEFRNFVELFLDSLFGVFNCYKGISFSIMELNGASCTFELICDPRGYTFELFSYYAIFF